MPTEQTATAPLRKDWKHRLGLGLLIYSFVPICTVELVAFLPLTGVQAVLFGSVYVASGEIAFLGAVALLGKPFIQAVKDKIKSFFRSKKPSEPKPISKTRHVVGVTLLLLSLLPYYLSIASLFFMRAEAPNLRALLYLLLSGEGLFILSLLVLGEEFWARLKRLFEWPGKEQAQQAI